MHGVGVAHRHRQDAGIGDDDVDPAEIGQSGLDGVAQFVAFTHVGDPRDHAPPKFFHRSFGVREVVGCRQRVGVARDVPADIEGNDVGARFGYGDGVRAPLAAGSSPDDGDLPSRRPDKGSSSTSVAYQRDTANLQAGPSTKSRKR